MSLLIHRPYVLALVSFCMHSLSATPLSFDGSFLVPDGPDDRVYALGLQDNQKIVIGGIFEHAGSHSRRGIARFNSDGSLDTSFQPGAGIRGSNQYTWISDLLIQEDGKILVVGDFNHYDDQPAQMIARLLEDGSLDGSFNSANGADRSIRDLVALDNGQLLVVGEFISYGGVPMPFMARIESDGSLDPFFSPVGVANGNIEHIADYDETRMVIAGDFTNYAGVSRQQIALIDHDGNLDESWVPQLPSGGDMDAISVLSDGRIAVMRYYKAPIILNADGSIDDSFQWPGVSGSDSVYGIHELSGGRLLFSGEFDLYLSDDGYSRSYSNLAILESDGSISPNLDLGNPYERRLDGWASLMVAAPDGSIYFSGNFDRLGDNDWVKRIGRLVPSPSATIQWTSAPGSIGETSSYDLYMRRNGNLDAPARVRVVSIDETAIAGIDYETYDEVIEFAEGEEFKSLRVQFIDNRLVDDDRQFRMLLTEPSEGLLLGAYSMVPITIRNDDSYGQFRFASLNDIVNEGQSRSIRIERLYGSVGAASVSVSAVSESAVAGVDYAFQDQRVYFADGETLKQVELDLIDNDFRDDYREITLELSDPELAQLYFTSTEVSLSIYDDEAEDIDRLWPM